MLQARKQPNRSQKAQPVSVPAPIGGLNAKDALANMPPEDAVQLENWFPEPSDCKVRNGSVSWATGIADPNWVETLMAYYAPTGAGKLFGIAEGELYDVTASGAVGAAIVSGMANSRHQHCMFSNAGSNYLYAVNGSDPLLLYNGTTWYQVTSISATFSITGVDPSTFIHVNTYKSRMFFIPKNSTGFWYLPVLNVSGAASFFDLGPLMLMGGYLMAMCTWSIDDASGLQEYATFITSQGEVFVYQGNDPNFASSWGLAYKFRMGRPVGRRCFEKIGSDVVIIGADGAVPLSVALSGDREQQKNAITYKIVNLINNDIQAYSGNFGWQPILYSMGNKLIINVPQTENDVAYQYVMNTVTGAWCKFTGWNAACFEVFNDVLYYGGNGTVYKADIGLDDDGAAIIALAQPAFNYFGSHQQKIFNMVRPIFTSTGTISAALGLCVNFGTTFPTSNPSFSGSSGSPWNTSPWNTSPWGGANNIIADWESVRGIGFSATIIMNVQSKDIDVSWQSTDYVFETGGIL